MLQLKNIVKSYKTGDYVQTALNDISVSFRDSEFVAVLGPSGSGKTTMLNVIGGLTQYDSGDLFINGKSTKEYKDKDWDAYRNYEVGFVFQAYNLINHQTILSNVELALTLSGISVQERRERAIKALEDVGLKDHIKKYPNQLSGGQMQRVAIARALVNNPSIIFADEPTGALDSKTSVQIMEILKKVSKDKLVVMVTHNPELAEEYASRIVKIEDGKIIDDSKPYEPSKSVVEKLKEKAEQFAAKQKTAMSFATALSLSFANLMGKKGRTIMTAFAGSIGIIGISAILSLSTGTSIYIDNVEHDTLAQYPLYISTSKSMIGDISESAQSGNMSQEIKEMQYNQNKDGKVSVRSVLSTMLSSSGANDLKSLKEYLETNPDNVNDYIDSIEYSYNSSPIIYSNDQYGTRELYPMSNLVSMGSNSSQTALKSSSTQSSSSSSYKFFPLPGKDDLYKNKYSLAAGKWPETTSECVLVLHKDGSINDSMLYTLGLRDPQELSDAVKAYYSDKKSNIPEEFEDVSYEDILGKTFKVVHSCDAFQKDATTGNWEDKSYDEAYMKNLVANSKDLTIVGIVNAPEGMNVATSLYPGINYHHDLDKECIEYANNSQIVQEQLARPDYDVVTGETFAEESSMNTSSTSSSDDSIIKINPSAIENAFSFDASSGDMSMPKIKIDAEQIQAIIVSSLDETTIQKIITEMATSPDLTEAMKSVIIQAVTAYVDYSKTHPSVSPTDYFSSRGEGYAYIQKACQDAGIALTPTVLSNIVQLTTKITTQLIQVFSTAIQYYMTQLTDGMFSMFGNFKFNAEALSQLFTINTDSNKLKQLSRLLSGNVSRTYETNLQDFGYADLSSPLTITIYPNNFNDKEKISATIDNYNSMQQEQGNTNKVISYTDYAKVLMQSVTTMIDMITAVLIAFVAISLIVSSIMIGIITYISVLERKKEIGILRAIGARKQDIFNVFNAETFIIGLVAGVFGVLVTAIGCIPANIVARHIFNVEYDIAILPIFAGIILIVISVGLTLVAGLIPSSSAAKKDPVEAINS